MRLEPNVNVEAIKAGIGPYLSTRVSPQSFKAANPFGMPIYALKWFSSLSQIKMQNAVRAMRENATCSHSNVAAVYYVYDNKSELMINCCLDVLPCCTHDSCAS